MTQTLHRVAVIGGGTMGAGIAEVAASAGHSVLLYDISAEAITRAIEGIRQRLDVRVGRGKSVRNRPVSCWHGSPPRLN